MKLLEYREQMNAYLNKTQAVLDRYAGQPYTGHILDQMECDLQALWNHHTEIGEQVPRVFVRMNSQYQVELLVGRIFV